MGRPRGLALALVLAVAVVASGCGETGARAASPDLDGTVLLEARYSKFSAPEIHVRRGQTVRFVIRNLDPIPHELIVGDQTVQDRHENGTETHHGERPGEISVPAGATAETTFTFSVTGSGTDRFFFGCHLPGHWAYGMRGTISVV